MWKEIDRFRKFGGVSYFLFASSPFVLTPPLRLQVRIEDDVVITEKGVENLTPLPREINEIETLMAQARQ